MSRPLARTPLGYALILLGSVACSSEKTPEPKRREVSPPSATSRSTASPADEESWDTAAGPVFAIAGASPSEAQLIFPKFAASQKLDTLDLDRMRPTDTVLELLSADGTATDGQIVSVERDTSADCATWPTAQVVGSTREPPTRNWVLAFPKGRVTMEAFDSLPSLSRADSSRLTIDIARAASKAPGDTAAAFRGRPFVVRQIDRFALDDGRALLSEVVRTVDQEASPLQEQLILVLERDAHSPDSSWRTAYSERAIGLEESLASVDLQAVLHLHNGTWALLLRREQGDGARLVLMERNGAARWAVRWRSAYAGC